MGYVTATDLDGDGNVDLYVGLANNGLFSGDPFGLGESYALMGNGDGSFVGAPSLPFTYTGGNLADLNGDKLVDAVGVNADGSLTAYLGDGKGGFTAASNLVTSPISIGGQTYHPGSIDSYALGDINGDGSTDLAYLSAQFNGPGGGPGVFLALGDGHGAFAAPTFYAVPSPLAAGDIDISWTISNLHLADVNHDGKADLVYNYVDTSSQHNTLYFGTVVQLGNGDGTFKTPQVIPYRSEVFSSTFNPMETTYVQLITDLNKDGNPDLVFIAQSDTIDHTLSTYVATIQVALGRGDGTFSVPVTVQGPDLMVQSFSNLAPASLSVVDMNGDGVPDIVALGSSASYDMQVAVALGNGDGTFKAPLLKNYTAQYLNSGQGLAVGDFDGDGHADVAIADPYTPDASGISLGNGDGTLQTMSLAINLAVGGGSVALDLNGDGKADIISGSVELLSQSGTTTVTPPVTPPTNPTPDFAVTASSPSGTVAAGQSVQTNLTLTPSGGFDQAVSLACSGLPVGATCAFAPVTVTFAGAPAADTVTIDTTVRSAQNFQVNPGAAFPGGLLLAALSVPVVIRRRRRWLAVGQWALMGLLLAGGLGLTGCSGDKQSVTAAGGGSSTPTGTPAGASPVTITATGGSTTHTITYLLTVN